MAKRRSTKKRRDGLASSQDDDYYDQEDYDDEYDYEDEDEDGSDYYDEEDENGITVRKAKDKRKRKSQTKPSGVKSGNLLSVNGDEPESAMDPNRRTAMSQDSEGSISALLGNDVE